MKYKASNFEKSLENTYNEVVNSPQSATWEEEFEKEIGGGLIFNKAYKEQVKSFIRSLLEKEREDAYAKGNKETCLRCGKTRSGIIHTCKLSQFHKDEREEAEQRGYDKGIVEGANTVDRIADMQIQKTRTDTITEILGIVEGMEKEQKRNQYGRETSWEMENANGHLKALSDLKEKLSQLIKKQ